MIRRFFENPMISNGRIVCDCCSQPIWEDEKFDVDGDGEIMCESCYKKRRKINGKIIKSGY